MIEARERNTKGLSRVPGSLGAVVWDRYTGMIEAEMKRVEAESQTGIQG